MNISKVFIDDEVKIEYETDAGSFKMSVTSTGEGAPSPDFTAAIAKLHPIYSSRLDLEEKRTSLFVTGLETGDDTYGEWFRISGTYRAHNISHKITTAKMRQMIIPFDLDEDAADDYEDSKAQDYPGLLTREEYEAMWNVLEQAQKFVGGERAQKSLDFEGEEGDVS